MKEQIQQLILSGKFFEAKKLLNHISFEQLQDILLNIGFNDNNICAYSFICFLISGHESLEFHSLASEILIHCFPQIGGYAAALYHVRKGIQLDPNDVEMMEMLLFFHDIPEKLVNDEEARVIATKVIEKKPESEVARYFIASYKSKSKKK
jgi:hypothetical protein